MFPNHVPGDNHGSPRRVVYLTKGHEVDLADENGLERLFKACFDTVMEELKDTDAFAKHGFEWVYVICMNEIAYVAGQLKEKRSGITMSFLSSEFSVYWDDLMEKLNSHNNEPP